MTEIAVMPVQPLETEYVDAQYAAEEAQIVEAAHSGWRSRIGRIAGRAALAMGLAVGGGAAIEAANPHAAEASSVSCYGDYCSGQYANETGCDQGATTIAESDITQQNYTFGFPWVISANGETKVGTVELRYSPTCKTKWALVKTIMDSGVSDVAVSQDTGYNQGRHIGGYSTGSPAAISASPMIYSPDNAVRAYVGGGSDDLIKVSTDWK